MTDDASDPVTDVLVLVSAPGNRRVLVSWVKNTEGHRLVELVDPDDEASLPSFDVCLADRPGIRRFADGIRAAQQRNRTFLPCLLVEESGRSLDGLDNAILELVDDVVTAPIDPAQLRFRIDTLARRRRLSQHLQESEARYRRLFELAPNAGFLLEDGEIRATNRAAEQFFDCDSEALVGRSLAAAVADEDRPSFQQLIAEAPSEIGPEGPRYRTVACNLDGDTAICEVAAVRTGESDERLVLVRDMTEHIERQRRLELYRRAMDEATIGVTITDPSLPDNPLIYVNDRFVEMTGYDREEALGHNCRFLQGDGTDEEAVGRIRAAIDDERPVTEIILNYRKNGEPFYNALDVMPVRDADNVVTNFLGFQRDVTEQVRNRRRLSVLDRVLRHNVRNRMNVVVGHTEQLSDHDDPAVREAAARIRGAGEELLEQSDTARRFRDVVSSGPSVEIRDLTADAREAIAEVRSGYPAATIHESLPDSAPVRGGQGIPLAVSELIENAAEHGESPIVVRVEPGATETLLTVSDQGVGIPEQELTVFSDDEEQPTEHSGGVGLWLIRWTVERAGGQIEYTGENETRVELSFPTANGKS
jgi:PAS domain S-box-containing protein